MNLIEKAAKRLEEAQTTTEPVSLAIAESMPVSAENRHAAEDSDTARTSAQVDLDLDALAAAGFITPNAKNSLIVDEFRVLKRPLLANAAGRSAVPIRHPNLIMVTSALPKDGKTFTAANLAMSIATELDRTVLLVDADVARPSLPDLLGLPARKGLLDVLQDPSLQLSDVLLRTNIPKLNLLMAGTAQKHATELLASGAMASLLQEMSTRYADRIIIFDSPPLLATTEAQVLATHMGQIVFIVRAEETLQSAVTRALASIEACPVKYMLLNQVRAAEPLTYGYGYRGY